MSTPTAQPDKNDVEMLEWSLSESQPPPTDSVPKNVSGALDGETSRTPEESRLERRLVLKADLLILPLLFVTYLLASLDRSDIGNAAVAGMVEDLHMTPHQLSTAASLFYVTYIIFQLPGNLFLRIITPPVQLALALMTWGTFNTLIAVAKGYPTVWGLRLGVGFGEAFFQAVPIYLTLWYKRNEYVNGLTAWGLEKELDGARGIAAWRWLFIVEGTISVAWGFVVLALLPPTPEKTRWFFTKPERDMAVRRTKEALNDPHAKIRPAHILEIFKDWTTYFYIVLYVCSNVSVASFGTFSPIILRSAGYSRLQSQVLTIPVYACGTVAVLVVSYLSDRFKMRGYILIGTYAFLILGWLILLASKNRELSYGASFLIATGVYSNILISLTWMNGNNIGFTRRAAMYASGSMVAQAFAIVATQLYSDPPHYYRGNGFALGSSVVGACTAFGLIVRLRAKNRTKRAELDSESAHRSRTMDIEEMGNKHPDFYYYT